MSYTLNGQPLTPGQEFTIRVTVQAGPDGTIAVPLLDPAAFAQWDREGRISVLEPRPDHEGDLIAAIRRQLAEPDWAPENDGDPTVTHVLITTSEWDNGYFYDTSGTAIYSDGTTALIDLDAAEDTLTELAAEGGQLGSQAGLLIRLDTGTVIADDYISVHSDRLARRDRESAP